MEKQNKIKSEELSRGQFLKQLGLSSATLMAYYCLGTAMSSCSSKKDDPTPVTPVGGGGNATKINFTLDLSTDEFKKLKTIGEFVIKDDLIIANANGNYVALSKKCTHQGTTIGYQSGSDDFKCSNHGSLFKTDGSVKGGPATESLKVYKTEVLDSGNKLRIFE
jgi:cytochrome b6-f complex iron-sulfur subunit